MYTGLFTFTTSDKAYTTGDEDHMRKCLENITKGVGTLVESEGSEHTYYFLRNVVKFEYYASGDEPVSEVMGMAKVELLK